MKANKKIVMSAIALTMAVLVIVSACKRNNNPGQAVVVTDEYGNPVTNENGEVLTTIVYSETVVVTDKNGVPITDENGEAITVVLETEIVEVTNANGEKVYDENGEVKTSVIYHPKDVEIPVTDRDGNVVTDKNGKVSHTVITVPAPNEPIITTLVQTDANGNTVYDKDGNPVTYTRKYTTSVVTPGSNSSNWGATFSGSKSDACNAVAPTSDGGYVALVQTNSSDGSFAGLASGSAVPYMVLMKFDSSGILKWRKAITSDGALSLRSLDTDASGNIIAAGYSNATNLGSPHYGEYDGVIYKFNSSGDMQWVQSYGGSLVDFFNDVSVCADGSIVAAGGVGSSDGAAAPLGIASGRAAALVAKYDASGNLIFAKAIGSVGDSFNGVDTDQSGNIYAVGNFSSSDASRAFNGYGKSDAAIVRLDGSGNVSWIRQFGGSGIDNANSVAAVSDGCVVVGRSNSKDNSFANLGNQGGYDAYAVKYSSSGSIAWQTPFRGYQDDTFTSIAPVSDGSFVVCGYSASNNRDLKTVGNKGGADGIIVTLGATGQVTSVEGYGGSRDDKFENVCVLSGGKYIAGGSTLSADGDLVGSKSDGANTAGMMAKFK